MLAYIKKQSLLEQEHRNRGMARAATTEDEDDEELQKVLKLSLQGYEVEEEDLYGAPSAIPRR